MIRTTLLLAAAALAALRRRHNTNDAGPNSAPNPYTTVDNFFKMPEGPHLGIHQRHRYR